jgi:hypothetical protein
MGCHSVATGWWSCWVAAVWVKCGGPTTPSLTGSWRSKSCLRICLRMRTFSGDSAGKPMRRPVGHPARGCGGRAGARHRALHRHRGLHAAPAPSDADTHADATTDPPDSAPPPPAHTGAARHARSAATHIPAGNSADYRPIQNLKHRPITHLGHPQLPQHAGPFRSPPTTTKEANAHPPQRTRV